MANVSPSLLSHAEAVHTLTGRDGKERYRRQDGRWLVLLQLVPTCNADPCPVWEPGHLIQTEYEDHRSTHPPPRFRESSSTFTLMHRVPPPRR